MWAQNKQTARMMVVVVVVWWWRRVLVKKLSVRNGGKRQRIITISFFVGER